MWTAASVLASSIIVLALLVYAGFLAARYFFLPGIPDEIHFARTSDGWRVAVYRYRAEGGKPAAEPVLLVPGVGANHYNYDLTDNTSLARYLASQGHCVWVLELRGRGLSTRPRLFSGLHYDWSFDEYAERDLPAAAETVCRVSGSSRLHLVGFSTGALAAYAWLADPHRTIEVGSLVSIGGPSTFKRAATHVSGRLVRNLRWARHRFLMRVLAPLSGYWHPSPIQLIHNPENMDGATQRRAMVNLIANFSRNELLQYGDWLLHDAFRSIDHRRDYRSELPRIEVPALFLAGSRDLLAPPDAVKDAYDAFSSKEKRFVILSRAQKRAVNYGHFDMLLGTHSSEEVYPVIREWLDVQMGRAPRAVDGNGERAGSTLLGVPPPPPVPGEVTEPVEPPKPER
jgi:pimeloyl-ACP methyl ester carboxylesterase